MAGVNFSQLCRKEKKENDGYKPLVQLLYPMWCAQSRVHWLLLLNSTMLQVQLRQCLCSGWRAGAGNCSWKDPLVEEVLKSASPDVSGLQKGKVVYPSDV